MGHSVAVVPDGIGYPIPDPIDPAEAVCIRVYVPADQLYIGAFWQAYSHFGKWVAWQKDAAHNAKDAAAVWSYWIELARAEWDIAQGECGVVNVRQSPTNPCVLQYQDTAGGSWMDFADLSLCVFSPGEKLYADADKWKEIDDFLWHLKSEIETIDSWLDGGKTETEIRIMLAGAIQRSPGISTLIRNMAALSTVDRQTAIDAIVWQEARVSLYCDNDDCTPLYSANYYNWLNCLSAAMFTFLDTLSNALFEDLNNAADWLLDGSVLHEWAVSAGGGGSAGFGGGEPPCGWEVEFDFTLSAYTWEILTFFGQTATWVSGQGFTHDGAIPPAGVNQFAVIARDFTSATITSVSLLGKHLSDSPFTMAGAVLDPGPSDGLIGYDVWSTPEISPVTHWFEVPVGSDHARLCLRMQCAPDGVTTVDGQPVLIKAIIRGTGTNPFI